MERKQNWEKERKKETKQIKDRYKIKRKIDRKKGESVYEGDKNADNPAYTEQIVDIV